MSESQKARWEAERETIKPRPQGCIEEGDKAEPKHVKAEPLPPIVSVD